MSLLCQPSEKVELIISDVERGLLPVRVHFDGTETNSLVLSLGYFAETWSVVFSDIGLFDPFQLIYRFEILDLFDFFVISNDLTVEREGALLGCLTLLKEYSKIRTFDLDRPGWRRFDKQFPVASGRYFVGVFEDANLCSVSLSDFDASEMTWKEAITGDKKPTHWLDTVGEDIQSLTIPVLQETA
jgi:hypothetical protein